MLNEIVFPVEEVVDNVSEEVVVEEQAVQDEVVIDQEEERNQIPVPITISGGSFQYWFHESRHFILLTIIMYILAVVPGVAQVYIIIYSHSYSRPLPALGIELLFELKCRALPVELKKFKRDMPWKDDNVRFTTIPLKHLFDKSCD